MTLHTAELQAHTHELQEIAADCLSAPELRGLISKDQAERERIENLLEE